SRPTGVPERRRPRRALPAGPAPLSSTFEAWTYANADRLGWLSPLVLLSCSHVLTQVGQRAAAGRRTTSTSSIAQNEGSVEGTREGEIEQTLSLGSGHPSIARPHTGVGAARFRHHIALGLSEALESAFPPTPARVLSQWPSRRNEFE